MADFAKRERQSVSDENYTLTLEQYLVAEKQAVVIFSIEAQTDAAIAEFNAVDERGNSTFWDMDTIGFGPVDYDKAYRSGFSTGSLNKKFDTERRDILFWNAIRLITKIRLIFTSAQTK